MSDRLLVVSRGTTAIAGSFADCATPPLHADDIVRVMRRFLRKRDEEERPTMDEVHRLFGVTMEMAQGLEGIIRGHASQVEYKNMQHDYSSQPFERLDRIDGKTMGWIEKRYELPEEASEFVAFARGVRNHLAHNFFASINKHTAEGRSEAMATLLLAIKTFGATGRAILAVYANAPVDEAPVAFDEFGTEPGPPFPVVDDATMARVIQQLTAELNLE